MIQGVHLSTVFRNRRPLLTSRTHHHTTFCPWSSRKQSREKMSFYDRRVCTNCGRMGVTKASCPTCNTCVYCKEKGHTVSHCPRVPPCGLCGKKGHKTEHCPNRIIRPLKPLRHPIKPLRLPIKTQPKDTSRFFNVSIKAETHDDSEWLALPREIREVSRSLISSYSIY